MPFQFNFYSSFLLIPFIQGLLFCVLLLTKTPSRYQLSNSILSMILLLSCIKIAYWMLGFAGWYDSHDAYTSFMFYFPFNNTIVLGPLLYFYFLSATNASFSFKKLHLRHLWLPLAWLLLIILKLIIDFVFYYPFPKGASFQFGTKGPWAELDKNILLNIISYGSFLYYLHITLKSYHSYRIYTSQNFSSMENIDFVWMRNLIYAIAAGVIIMLCYQMINWIWPLSYKADWYSYLFLGYLIYYISLKSYQMKLAHIPVLQFLPPVEELKTVVSEKTTVLNLE